ncbi:unnamed protein product [Ixodes persulcatus]
MRVLRSLQIPTLAAEASPDCQAGEGPEAEQTSATFTSAAVPPPESQQATTRHSDDVVGQKLGDHFRGCGKHPGRRCVFRCRATPPPSDLSTELQPHHEKTRAQRSDTIVKVPHLVLK